MKEFYLDNMLLGMKSGGMLHKFGVNGKTAGSLAAIREIYNAVPVLYGPKGCAFHFKYSVRGRNGVYDELENVDLNNTDVIFGGIDKLRELVLKIDKKQHPDFIFILPTVVSDIINDDVMGMAGELQQHVNARIVVVASQAFSHMDKNNSRKVLQEKAAQGCNARYSGSAVYPGCGYVEVMDALVQQVMEKRQKQPRTVNIESFIWGYGGVQKLQRMKKLLIDMGVIINTLLPAADVGHIQNASCASLNIVRRKKWAIAMQKKFGTDYLHLADMEEWHGIGGIRDFYLAIGQKLGLLDQARKLIDGEIAKISSRYEELRQKFSAYKFCLVSESFATLPKQIEIYQETYGLPLCNVCLILNPAFQKETGIDKATLDKMHAKIYMTMQNTGCRGKLIINPDMEQLQSAAQWCDYLICGSNPRYSSLNKPILPMVLNRPIFDFQSFMEIMEEIADRLQRHTNAGSHLLLNRLDFDPLFFLVEKDDFNTLASREMYSRMWRMRKR